MKLIARIALRRGRRAVVVVGTLGVVALVAALAAVAFYTATGSATVEAGTVSLASPAVTVTNPTPGVAHVAWTAVPAPGTSAFDDEVEFTVERKPSSGSTWSFVCDTATTRKAYDELSCDDPPTATGDYDYRVTAYFRSWTSSDVGSAHVVVDATPPTVAAIARADVSPTDASSVDWTVTFSEPVTGVDEDDFALVGVGASAASITSVAGAGSTRTVTVATGADGSLGLNLADDDSIADLAANPLGGVGQGNGDFTGEAYAIDRTAPSVTSVTRDDVSPTNAAVVAWTLTFSEGVSGVDASDLALAAAGLSGTPTIQSVTPIGASTYTVTATTGSGTPSGSGAVRLDVADDDSIADSLGNPLGGPGAANGDFSTGEAYTIDKTQPSVTVEQHPSQTDPTDALPITYAVTFSEPVSGFDASDLTRTGTATGGSVVVNGSGDSYEIVVTDPATTLGNGTLGFTVGAAAAVDAAGNDSLPSSSDDNVVTYDTVAPAVTLSATGSAGAGGWRNAPFTVSASATDALSGVASCQPDLAYSGPDTASDSITRTCVDNAGNVGSASYPFKYDATAPTVTLAASPGSPNGTNGWYRSAVTFTPSQTDATSGPDTCESAITYSGPDSATASVTRTCTDNAGNVGSASATFKYDATSPSVSLTPSPASPNGTNGWYRTAVTWTPSQTDATSGPASCQSAVVYNGPDSATASVTRTCTDAAGNTGSASETFKYDATAPSGSITAPANGASVSGATVSVASTNATDATSDVASVQFQLRPTSGSFTNLGLADTSTPYGVTWDTTTVANGGYVLQAIVTDGAGNTSTTAPSNATVANVYTFAVGTIANQTAGASFGGFTLQLRLNGADSTTFNGMPYSGAKTISFSGSAVAASPSGATATASSSVSFTDGLATVPAGAVTLVKAATGVSLTVSDNAGSPTITGTSNSFDVLTGNATRLAWSAVSGQGTPPSLCLFTCSWDSFGNNGNFNARVAVTDNFGNIATDIGSGHTLTVTRTGDGGNFTSPATTNPITLTVASSGNAVTPPFTFRTQNGNWTSDTLTAHVTSGTAYSDATAVLFKN